MWGNRKAKRMIRDVQDQLYAMPGTIAREKSRRVYYQDIVYSVCQILDNEIGGKTVCGTIENQDSDVIERLKQAFGDNSKGSL